MEILSIVKAVSEHLDCAWAVQGNGYRIDFADGFSIRFMLDWKDVLNVGVMLGGTYVHLPYSEKPASISFKTRNPKYIATAIEREIISKGRDQWRRCLAGAIRTLEANALKLDRAQAIAAQFRGEAKRIHSVYTEYEIHQYAAGRESMSYRIGDRDVDVKGFVSHETAVWLAYVIANPESLSLMSEMLVSKQS